MPTIPPILVAQALLLLQARFLHVALAHVGEVTVEAKGDVYQITGALEKTQIGSQPEAGRWWPEEATANNKKQALDKAYSLGKDIIESLKPVGSGTYTKVGHSHDWDYGNPLPGEPCVCPPITFGDSGESWMPTAFRWKEVKHALSWKVTWDVRMPNTDDGARAGKYLLVGDQRSQQLSKKPKLFMTQMVGRMMKVGPSTTSKPEVRRALGEWREASGTGNLSGGVARVSHYGKVTE